MIAYKKKFIQDMIISIVSSMIPIAVLQLIILPFISRTIDSESYGIIIVVISIFSTFPEGFGGALNNIRLIKNNEYEANNIQGDFNILVIILEAVCTFVTLCIVFISIKEVSVLEVLGIAFVSITCLLKEYYIVEYRLKINYWNILLSNVFLSIGYIIGYFVVYKAAFSWLLIYIIGNCIQLLYIFKTTRIYREKYIKTQFFKKTANQTILLLIASLLMRIVMYADKLVILPVLGATAVAIYYAATLSGKIVSLMINPIASVMLSYLGKKDTKDSRQFYMTLLIGLFVGCIGYLACVLVSKTVLNVLYPMYCNDAMHYIYVTTATAVTAAIISLINPFILRYYSMRWQVVINSSTVLFFFLICTVLSQGYGLMGFCIGALMCNIYRIGLSMLIFMKKTKQKHAITIEENNNS